MLQKVDPVFGEKFISSVNNFYDYGVHHLFNDWWEKAPPDAIKKYLEAIETHPEQAALAAERWYAQPLELKTLEGYAIGTLGHAYLSFMVDNNLVERLALGYREFHDELARSGKLNRLPPTLEYKVLRGYQLHDLHHVLTGFPATPLGELSLQAFELAQQNFPYSAMWISVVTAHMALVDPYLINPAMDAITQGWTLGRQSRSIQFIKFETMLERSLDEVRSEFCLQRDFAKTIVVEQERVPALLAPK